MNRTSQEDSFDAIREFIEKFSLSINVGKLKKEKTFLELSMRE